MDIAPQKSPRLSAIAPIMDEPTLLADPPPIEQAEFDHTEAPDGPELVIEPLRGWQSLNLAELWRYRELIWLLTVRDITVRYKQTLLGPIWVLIQPLLTTGIFAAVFAVFMRGEAPTVPGVPYPVSTFCGMTVWLLFANSLGRCSGSLINGQNLMTKVYFPRLVLPLAAVLSGLVDFVVTLAVLFLMMACYGVTPGWQLFAVPLFALLAIVTATAVGTWLAALSAVYRDFGQVEGVLIRIGMYLTPVAYTTASIAHVMPSWARTIYQINPMAQAIEGFRWALFPGADPPGAYLACSLMLVAVLLAGGLQVFRRMEGTVIDMV